MKCSFCKHTLLYVNKIERNTAQQMILYKCRNCKIKYKTYFRQENDLIDKFIVKLSS